MGNRNFKKNQNTPVHIKLGHRVSLRFRSDLVWISPKKKSVSVKWSTNKKQPTSLSVFLSTLRPHGSFVETQLSVS